MKIIIAIPCLLQGGTEMQTLNLSRALQSAGHKVTIICYFEFKNVVVREFQNAGVNVLLLRLERNIGFLRLVISLRNEFKRTEPDVIHVQYLTPGALPIIASRLAGIKIVFATIHQPYTKSHPFYSRFILRTASLMTSAFIAVSLNAEKSWFGESSLFNENMLHGRGVRHFTIYNAVDIDRINEISNQVDKNSLKQYLGLPKNKIIVGALSRLSFEKGLDLLVEAFSKLISDRFDIHLLIVGSGEQGISIKKRIEVLKLERQITLKESQDWTTAMYYLSLMDLVIVPSRFEGFGLTAVEAMAAGKPIVTSDSFGLVEINKDRETGLLFASGNYDSLYQQIRKMISNPDQFKSFGVNGRLRARSLFSIEVFNKKIAALYSDYIS